MNIKYQRQYIIRKEKCERKYNYHGENCNEKLLETLNYDFK